jgi:hypothetical protein
MRLTRVDIRPSKKPFPPSTTKTIRDGIPIFRHPIPETVFELLIQLDSKEETLWNHLTPTDRQKIVGHFTKEELITLVYKGQGQITALSVEGAMLASDPVEVGKLVVRKLTKMLQDLQN